MSDFDKWVEQQRLSGFLEHSITLGDVKAAWNAAAEVEREACAKIVEKMAGADEVYPAGIEMIVATIRVRSTIT